MEFMLVAEKDAFFSPDTYQLMVNWWVWVGGGWDIWDFLMIGIVA